MPSTPTYALRYPANTDPPNVPLDMQNLATDIETKIAPGTATGQIPVWDNTAKTWTGAQIGAGTTFPASPYDGQEYFYVADATNGIVWRFRYRAASASTYKWEFVGGSPLTAEIATAETMAGTATWTDLATAGPLVALPRTGDYLIQWNAACQCDTAGTILYVAPLLVSAGPFTNDATDFHTAVAGTRSTVGKIIRRSFASTGNVKLQYSSSAGGTLTFLKRNLTVWPIRVS